MFLEYWLVLWEEMFTPTNVFAGYRGERSSRFLYCISLFFFYVEYIIYGDTRLWRTFPSLTPSNEKYKSTQSPILHGYGSGHYKSLAVGYAVTGSRFEFVLYLVSFS